MSLYRSSDSVRIIFESPGINLSCSVGLVGSRYQLKYRDRIFDR